MANTVLLSEAFQIQIYDRSNPTTGITNETPDNPVTGSIQSKSNSNLSN